MDRRSILKAAAAGIAAACGWKAAKKTTVTFQGAFEAPITQVRMVRLRSGAAPSADGASFIVENEHGTFECVITPDGTTWRAV